MSVRVMTLAWSVEMPASDKLVLLALADCANDEGHCWPGIASLCKKTGKCKRSLQESLRALDKAGHITRTENPGKGMNYTVHPVAIPATGSKTCTGSKKASKPVAKSAPKPLGTVNTEAKASLSRKSRLNEGWQPQQFADGSKCRRIVDGWSADLRDTQVEKFKAYHIGRGSTWVDWQQAWKTWVLNAPEFARPSSPQRHGGEPVPLWKHLKENERAAAGATR